MPQAVLFVLTFDRTPLWVTVCFLRAISTREEAFVEGFELEGFELDGKEILSMDSALNENTSLLWIKIDLL